LQQRGSSSFVCPCSSAICHLTRKTLKHQVSVGLESKKPGINLMMLWDSSEAEWFSDENLSIWDSILCL